MPFVVTNTKQHILQTVEAMLKERPSADLRVSDVAKRSSIAVPTIYYHFTTRAQMIAQAQMHAYAAITAPMRDLLMRATSALDARDVETFWDAVRDDLELAWTLGQHDDWGTVKLIIDIWADDATRVEFCAALDDRFDKWTDLLSRCQEVGWAKPDLDPHAVLAAYWPSTIGLPIIAHSSRLQYSARSVCEFYLSAIRASE